MTWRALFAVACVLIFQPGTVLAQTAPDGSAPDETSIRIERLAAAFAGWLSQNEARGVLVAAREGRVVARIEHGLQADETHDLASLGKAITGMCAAELVSGGALDWSDTVAYRLGRGPGITLAQLVTHTSGLATDSTQAIMLEAYGEARAHASADVLDAVIARGGPSGEAGRYRYNNENYALAALMIEAATGQDYASVCAERVIAPLGLGAMPSEVSAASLPWGGWAISPVDFAIWHGHWFGSGTRLGRDPKGSAHSVVVEGVHYGPGTFFRTLSRGNTFWHFGALCFPGRFEIGTYAVTLFGDWTLVAIYDRCVDGDAMRSLDTTLVPRLFEPLP